MKNTIVFVLVSALLSVLAGCAVDSSPEPTPEPGPATQSEALTCIGAGRLCIGGAGTCCAPFECFAAAGRKGVCGI